MSTTPSEPTAKRKANITVLVIAGIILALIFLLGALTGGNAGGESYTPNPVCFPGNC